MIFLWNQEPPIKKVRKKQECEDERESERGS